MGRKNPFAKSSVLESFIEHSNNITVSDVVSHSSIDNLPPLETPKTNIELKIIGFKGQQLTLIIDHCERVDINKLSSQQRKGKKSLKWFHQLHAKNPSEAFLLLRILLKFYKESSFSNSHKFSAFSWLAEYVIYENISLYELTLSDFNNIINKKLQEAIARDVLVFVSNQLKHVINLIPSIPENTKKTIINYKLPNPFDIKIRNTLTAIERIKASKLTNDYSDYVMFQIYAYVNAGLSEIKESHQRLDDLLTSNKLPDLFSRAGLKKYREFILSNTNESYKRAFDMELVAFGKIQNAYTMLIDKIPSSFEMDVVSQKVLNFDYDAAFKVLPIVLQNDVDIIYLFKQVFPIAISKNKNARRALSNFGKTREAKIHQLLQRPTFNWREMENWLASYESFKSWLANHYCCYWMFYGDVKKREYVFSGRNEGIHNVLTGRTAHYDYLLMLLLLCESGRNREVILSIPAYINDLSVLEIDAAFATEPSCLLTGFKKRGHLSGKGVQQEDIEIPRSSALYDYLRIFEEIRHGSHPNRSYFFGNEENFQNKCISLGESFRVNCGLKNQDGTLVGSFETKKFRKVWSGEVLLEYMKDIHTKDDLIRAIAEDLRNTIPLTYLLQSSRTEGMLASTIVGLQIKFVEKHRSIAANLKLKGEKSFSEGAEKRYLCDCTDPYNPDFFENLDIEYCNQFDMCLGCSRALVFEEHLSNIIYRCFQYEQILSIDSKLYAAHYEVKHDLAVQVIERFKTKSENGHEKHASAFKQAVEAWEDPNQDLIPPLIHPSINVTKEQI